jgi:hypothetical protein
LARVIPPVLFGKTRPVELGFLRKTVGSLQTKSARSAPGLLDGARGTFYRPAMSVKSPLYDRDFYAWSREQTELLRAGKLAEADIEHIAEEIDSMGRTEKRELISRLSVLLLHLLKWRHQPSKRGPS